MNNAARRALAAAALSGMAACTPTTPEPQHTPFNDDSPRHGEARDAADPTAGLDAALAPDVRIRATKRATRSQAMRSNVGGDLPPERVAQCESGGSYSAENPTSTASGKWQIVDSSWNGYGGYQHAADAPPDVQDAKARQMWNGGKGASHWKACL